VNFKILIAHFEQETRVIVTGVKLISKFFSVQVPEYLPLLVLHDPPGGLSPGDFSPHFN
jgi:hypothetical protein